MAAEPGNGGASGIVAVSVSEPFFNPTIGQREAIRITLADSGLLSVSILDRDGYLVRRLLSGTAVAAETLWYQWDGRDDDGQIVPDEAYSLKVDLAASRGTYSYVPAGVPAHAVRVDYKGYERLTGVLSYKLDSPARVHAQAGAATLDPRSRERAGPVLKTIANREPRPGGAIIENWDGFDETGAIYVPDLAGFAVAVAATSLPENAIITSGNLSRTFVDGIGSKRVRLLRADRVTDHSHHRGLTALDDLSPSLRIVAKDARYSEGDRLWHLAGRSLSGRVFLAGPSSARFGRQPAELQIFVNGRRAGTEEKPADGGSFQVDLSALPPGDHIVAFNWVSRYGPAAVSCLRVRISDGPRPSHAAVAARGEHP